MTKRKPSGAIPGPDYVTHDALGVKPAAAAAAPSVTRHTSMPRPVPVIVDDGGEVDELGEEPSIPVDSSSPSSSLPSMAREELAARLEAAGVTRAAPSQDWRAYPKGPHDVRRAMPWDAHTYPPAPGVPSPGRAEELRRRAWRFVQLRAWPWLKRAAWSAAERAFWAWLEDWLDGGKGDAPRPPALPPGQTFPALPPGGDLPALPPGEPVGGVVYGDPGEGIAPGAVPMPSLDELADAIKDPVAAGVYSTEPLDRLDAYLRVAGIRYFSARELCEQKWRAPGWSYKGEDRGRMGRVIKGVACWSELLDALPPILGKRRGLMRDLPQYVVPPVEVWHKILPTLYVLDRFRAVRGRSVNVISGYRCPAYNWQIGGDKVSRHTTFEACDFQISGAWIPRKSVDKRKDAKDENILDFRVFEDFFNHMYRNKSEDGVGRYDTFIHLDVGTRGGVRGLGKSKSWDLRSHKW